MLRRTVLALACAASLWPLLPSSQAKAEEAYGRQWARTYGYTDWNRFYHYPYVYYPQNFWSTDYYRSAESLYYRYPPEMREPVFNGSWHNELPQPHKYYRGYHFVLDVF